MTSAKFNSSIETSEDIEKEIENVSRKLKRKYSRRSYLNEEKMLKHNGPVAKTFSIIFTVITVLITLFSVIVCLSTLINSSNKNPNSLFGRSALQVSSGSMTAPSITIDGKEYESGFNIGDKITVCPVDPHTLKPGDKIAFYAYQKNYLQYHSLTKHEIYVSPDLQPKAKLQFCHYFGFHTPEIVQAGKDGGMLTFHHITNVYEDQNHKLWFKTQGSANAEKDSWFISEEMILGIYDDSSFGKSVLGVIDFLGKDIGFIIFLLVPIALIIAILLHSVILDLQLSLLELDVVEQKRKLTDEICVKYKVGFRMDTKTKYKVLQQAEENEKQRYVELLWPDGTEPDAMKKYVTKRKVMFLPIKKLLKVNQICEARFNAGEDIKEIAKYYAAEKAKIKQEERMLENKLKTIHKMLKEKKRKGA